MSDLYCVIDPGGYTSWTNCRKTAAKWARAKSGSTIWAPDDKLWAWTGPRPGSWQLLDDPATYGYGDPRGMG